MISVTTVHRCGRVYDLHATLLHALGLDHISSPIRNEGRADSLTDVSVTDARVMPAFVELLNKRRDGSSLSCALPLVYGLYSRPKREGQ